MIVFIGKDRHDGQEIRTENREKHVAKIKKLHDQGLIHFAGPFIDDQGRMSGSLIIFDTEDLDMIKNIMAKDPYVRAGLFASTQISRIKKVF
ncbi:MAG: YciI family protein [Desulfonatronovibrio sp.]